MTVKELHSKYLERALSQIRQYAHEHSLSAQQVRDIFTAGMVQGFRDGSLKTRVYREGEFPGRDLTVEEERMFAEAEEIERANHQAYLEIVGQPVNE